ncbi:MAG: hypothetical protein GEV09_26700, partial [Pseudonocardiaceae bacterium]|nr:hypothetical protein [Pseudonocardiaceae bacterium]
GTRANIDEFTETTASSVEVIGGAQRGKAIIILNPVEPPLMMRNSIFCAIPEGAGEPGPLQDKILDSIHAMVRTVQEYVRGYHLRADPQFDPAQPAWGGHARVFVPVEVKGGGDYLPDYAGNLDIITAAAARVGDMMLAHRLGIETSWKSTSDLGEQPAASGSSFNYGFSHTDELTLISAAAEEVRQAKIAVLLVPGIGTMEELRKAHDAGASLVRIATHCTEADVSIQHFQLARDLGMETVGF